MKLVGATILLDQLRTSKVIEELDPRFQEALKMGVAALERESKRRTKNPTGAILPLRGETFEGVLHAHLFRARDGE